MAIQDVSTLCDLKVKMAQYTSILRRVKAAAGPRAHYLWLSVGDDGTADDGGDADSPELILYKVGCFISVLSKLEPDSSMFVRLRVRARVTPDFIRDLIAELQQYTAHAEADAAAGVMEEGEEATVADWWNSTF
jgi:hypothetical protein